MADEVARERLSAVVAQDPASSEQARRLISFYERSNAGRILRPRRVPGPALHCGFWQNRTRSNAVALTNMDRLLAGRAGLRTGERVLDAGCGFGRSAVWLAREYGAEVVGINLVLEQIQRARSHACNQNVAHKVTFEQQDFTRTSFPDESFDVVWAMESGCHAPDKEMFLAEARRLLRPGGRLVVADLFRWASAFEPDEEALLGRWLSGWAIPALYTPEDFADAACQAGFADIRIENVTASVEPSLRRLYYRAKIGRPIVAMLRATDFGNDAMLFRVLAGRLQYEALRRGLWFYGVFNAANDGVGSLRSPLERYNALPANSNRPTRSVFNR